MTALLRDSKWFATRLEQERKANAAIDAIRRALSEAHSKLDRAHALRMHPVEFYGALLDVQDAACRAKLEADQAVRDDD